MLDKELSILVESGMPGLVWGNPGVGKTRNIDAIARGLDRHLETVIVSIHEPAELRGMYYRENGNGLVNEPPPWAKRIQRVLEKGRKAILFLDEISTAPPASQAAALRIIWERVVGDLELPMDKVAILAAANPPEVAAGGWDLSAPMANRFCHLFYGNDMSALTENWLRGLKEGWPAMPVVHLPDDWRDYLPQARNLVAGYIRSNRTALQQIPENEDARGRAWPSPRMWDDGVARVMAACMSVGLWEHESDAGSKYFDTVVMNLVEGCIGTAQSGSMFTFIRNLDLPDPEQALATPRKFKVPARDDVAYVAIDNIIAAAVGKPSKARFVAAWNILGAYGRAKKADMGVSAAKVLMTNKPSGVSIIKDVDTDDMAPYLEPLKQIGLV